MNRNAAWLLVGLALGIAAVGPWGDRSQAGTGPATIRINDRQLSLARLDHGRRGTSPGDMEVVRTRLQQRGTGKTLGHGELVCTYVDGTRTRVCQGTFTLPKGKLFVGGTILYRQFYDLAVLGGTGLYDNARGSLTVTRTGTKPVRNLLFFRLVG